MNARLTIPDVIDRFLAYHAQNPTWGSLHIVLEDPNVSDHDVQWCIDRAIETGDAEGEALGRILLQMTKTQRGKIDDVCFDRERAAKTEASR